MMRATPSQPVLVAMLALALLVGLVLPASAAPNTVIGPGDSLATAGAVTAPDAPASIDGPGHHFGFTQASVVAQVTASQAQQVLAGLGYTGVATNPCVVTIGQVCQVTGAITGSATITGSASWNITVTAPPAGALVGGIPQAFALTTANAVGLGEGPFPCSAFVAGTATTCAFVTAGNPLLGTTVAVCYPPAAVGGLPLCVVGTVTGVGVIAPIVPPVVPPPVFPPVAPPISPPLLPPPPQQFIPPPPPPLLPPPPPAPTGALTVPSAAAYPAVPVIPEADSFLLVVGGLVALSGLVGYRRVRRRA
jgi:hypothetical protein